MPPSRDKVRVHLQIEPELSDAIDELVNLLRQRRALRRSGHRNELVVELLQEAIARRLEEERGRK